MNGMADMNGGGVLMVDPNAPQQDPGLQMSPELLALLQQIAGTPEEQEMLGQMSQLGLGMFGTPNAQGMNVGGTYKAASPVEHLSVGLQRALGAKQYTDAMDQMGQNNQKVAGARGSVMADILAQMMGGGGLKPSPF